MKYRQTLEYPASKKENSLREDFRRFSTKSDLTEFVSRYSENSDKCLTLPDKAVSDACNQSAHKPNQSCLKRNTTLTNTYRKPNFKFDGNMLNRVQNMSLSSKSKPHSDKTDKKTNKQLSLSSTNLTENRTNQVSLESSDSGIYMPSEI